MLEYLHPTGVHRSFRFWCLNGYVCCVHFQDGRPSDKPLEISTETLAYGLVGDQDIDVHGLAALTRMMLASPNLLGQNLRSVTICGHDIKASKVLGVGIPLCTPFLFLPQYSFDVFSVA